MALNSDLKYSLLAEFYEKIEKTTSRIAMTEYLVSLFKKTPTDVIDKVIYLTQGKLRPDYEGVELGIAEKLAMRAIAKALAISISEVEKEYNRSGDIGLTVQNLMQKRRATSILDYFGAPSGLHPLTVSKVYDTLVRVAKASGVGAQETKINLLISLLKDASPNEAKYILRIVTGKLRLGIADMTILDALSIAFTGTKSAREIIERAYNVHPDLGYIAKVLATKGIEGVKDIRIKVGIPVLPMLAERLNDPVEILKKLGGECLAEYKYDGERVQVHKDGNRVLLFSRRLENITHHYPDVVEYMLRDLDCEKCIVEGEIVAVDLNTGDMLPFQDLMHRRRKYDVKRAMEEYPVNVYLFDILFVDGEELIEKPLPERRKYLEKIVKPTEEVKIAVSKRVDNPNDLMLFFEQAVSMGCEGIMCKSTLKNSIYQMGARGWLWIKFKRDYQYEMTDTVDLVVIGAFHGRGRRAGTYGALLMAAYSPEEDAFKTVCKVGSGFTDEDLEQLPKLLEPYKIPHRHPRVISKMDADIWFVPAIVLEIIGAEITLSPLHTCALNKIERGVGLAIRFPRFTGRYRFDKKAEQATTEEELIEMYKSQKKTKVMA